MSRRQAALEVVNMKLISTFAIIGAARFAAAILESTDFAVGQIVKTTSGSVQGHAAPGNPDVSEYLGIPFVHQANVNLLANAILTVPQ